MAYRKKLRVPGLDRSESFTDSQKPVLRHYLNRVLKQAKKFRKDGSAENLHSLRISLRRFRYVLELPGKPCDHIPLWAVDGRCKAKSGR